jgi:hypothetical protein
LWRKPEWETGEKRNRIDREKGLCGRSKIEQESTAKIGRDERGLLEGMKL